MPTLRTPSVRCRRERGYTLLELTICLPLLTLLMLGMGSAIHIAARAIPNNQTAASSTMTAASVIDQASSELSFASTITSRSATALTFAVADRTGDGAAESITYSWAGTAGAPLLRQMNGYQAEALLPSVQQFALSYDAPIDVATGLPLLRTVSVRLLAPLGSTTGVEAVIATLNQPQLP